MRFSERFTDDEFEPNEEDLRGTAQEDAFVEEMMKNHKHDCSACGVTMLCEGDCGYPVHARCPEIQ